MGMVPGAGVMLVAGTGVMLVPDAGCAGMVPGTACGGGAECVEVSIGTAGGVVIGVSAGWVV